MASSALEVRGLRVERGGREVLHGISLDLEAGAITALLGANGAGKSTTVLAVAGALPSRSGSVKLDGVELLGAPPYETRRRGVAVAAEGHPVLPGLSVLDNLRVAALALPRLEAEREVEEALSILPELRHRLTVDARDLSGGQKQMVTIAQALIARPRFLLVDELSFGLAPAIVARLGDTVRAIAKRGVGVLLIEQFTNLALDLASRAYVMERGQMVFSGTSAELSSHPEVLHNAYLAAGTADIPSSVPA